MTARYDQGEAPNAAFEIPEIYGLPEESAEKLKLLYFAMTVAEKLDALEEKLDLTGPPARHAALIYQRIARLKKEARF